VGNPRLWRWLGRQSSVQSDRTLYSSSPLEFLQCDADTVAILNAKYRATTLHKMPHDHERGGS